MPWSAKRRCKCGRLVRGECEACRATNQREYDAQRDQTPERQHAKRVYANPAWEALRRRVYQRDSATCADCGRLVEWSDYHCDHIQPLDQRPDLAFDEANLQVMHARCHRRKTAKGE